MIKRLGIFGGAFDPVHKGHTQSLKFINDLKIVDEVYTSILKISDFIDI